jgi:type II secretion system protein G
MFFFNKKIKGFTLVELMIVIAVVGILSSVALPSFIKARRRAKMQGCRANLKTLNSTVEHYNIENGSYPSASTEEELKKELSGYFKGGSGFPECPNGNPYIIIHDIPGQNDPSALVEVMCPEHGMYDDELGAATSAGN